MRLSSQGLRDRRQSITARFSGVRTDETKIAAFVISGVTASLAGMMLAARSTAGNPTLGAGLELDVIVAVIIGGTSLFGGYGSIIGSVVRAIFIGILGLRPSDDGALDRRQSITARFSGVRTDETKIAAFVISGVTASLAGMMLAARSTAGNPTLGAGLELDVIVAVIIGGTSLFGGYGSIIGSVVRAIFIGILGLRPSR